MEQLSTAAEQLTWDKLWLYMTLLAILVALLKISSFVDAYIARMRARAELMNAEAKLLLVRAENEAIVMRGTGCKPKL